MAGKAPILVHKVRLGEAMSNHDWVIGLREVQVEPELNVVAVVHLDGTRYRPTIIVKPGIAGCRNVNPGGFPGGIAVVPQPLERRVGGADVRSHYHRDGAVAVNNDIGSQIFAREGANKVDIDSVIPAPV